MRQPFQCVAITSRSSNDEDLFLAAGGSKLYVLGLTSKKVVSEWPPNKSLLEGHDNSGQSDERPAKKQRTEAQFSSQPIIIKLTVSVDGQYAATVTEDKYVRVFRIGAKGELEDLSQRCMPKRPCAIEILPNNLTILCGDKFGDVYSLPLHPGDPSNTDFATRAADIAKPSPKDFIPSATNLTVHTKRNLQALKTQMAQKNFSARKEPLAFEHKLLLGHVSMLTDMKYATRVVGSKQRSYIITADRDEHIRISRGSPQSHVIEGYCLDHEEFVSRLCLLPQTDMLVSGGGDEWLCLWDWAQFKLIRRIALKPLIQQLANTDAALSSVAISGLWANQVPDTILVVAIEKLPALFVISLSSLLRNYTGYVSDRMDCAVVELDGCPIDVTWVNGTMIVSQDAREDRHARLLAFDFEKLEDTDGTGDALRVQRLESSSELVEKLSVLDNCVGETIISAKALDELLYSVNNLRKRRDSGAEQEEEEQDAAEEPEE